MHFVWVGITHWKVEQSSWGGLVVPGVPRSTPGAKPNGSLSRGKVKQEKCTQVSCTTSCSPAGLAQHALSRRRGGCQTAKLGWRGVADAKLQSWLADGAPRIERTKLRQGPIREIAEVENVEKGIAENQLLTG